MEPEEVTNSKDTGKDISKGSMDISATGPDISSQPQEPNGSKRTKASNKSRKSKAKSKKPQNHETFKPNVDNQKPSQKGDKDSIETREEMYDRLKNGAGYLFGDGTLIANIGTTRENPEVEIKTMTYPEEKVQKCKFSSQLLLNLLGAKMTCSSILTLL